MLKHLSEVKGRPNEMVTLYVPPSRRVEDATARIQSEAVQAENVKSRQTRTAITTALGRLTSLLRQFKETPPHGLACFVGGDEEIIIEPPDPVQTYLYRCGSGFVLDPLEAMARDPEVYGLIVMDRAEASFGWLRGTRIAEVDSFESNLMGKHHMGGQSAQRFQRIMEGETLGWLRKVGERSNRIFLSEIDNVLGVFVGGPGAMKEDFVERGELDYRIRQKIVTPLFSTGYTNEHGLKELSEAASQTRQDMAMAREKAVLGRFLTEVRTGSKATYGESQVKEALSSGRVDALLISEDRDDAPELVAQAEAAGAKAHLISSATDEGRALLKGYGGLAAMLRW
ncbi:MAG: peptide chain release factor aRF-1 [Euryarchaeota archaeon]|nr:peptide chain release factor aRF-1 [Euryarchaeota archaeon]MDE1837401.1 peptide chain release factor aRF-1 [Euryarchaeota archaeon]MDE1879916.1 peptide chain release factor aRF-1 [Euryarchaeota archaeon]MDE2045499.1 peptide chain release factor aRF-1 [Thermoplasmata archaeon]